MDAKTASHRKIEVLYSNTVINDYHSVVILNSYHYRSILPIYIVPRLKRGIILCEYDPVTHFGTSKKSVMLTMS